ncbi:MAG TPA: glycoside hydrolase family 36 N-terminal domain-containing protein, partial [Actinoplanes sp.]|nr:glycoside hydrolase family 36 N-terminal domain-containing protein [Actinoplanes sp.]
MPMHVPNPDATVALTAAGVTLLVDIGDGGLPAIVHWGRELAGLDGPGAAALIRASEPVAGTNNIDPVPRLTVLPEHRTGWTGRPGLRGSSAGAGWSPAFTTTGVRLDGTPVSGFVSAGAGVLEVTAADDDRLELRLEIELLPSGLLRGRAAVTNAGDEEYQVEDLVLAFPVPAEEP